MLFIIQVSFIKSDHLVFIIANGKKFKMHVEIYSSAYKIIIHNNQLYQFSFDMKIFSLFILDMGSFCASDSILV